MQLLQQDEHSEKGFGTPQMHTLPGRGGPKAPRVWEDSRVKEVFPLDYKQGKNPKRMNKMQTSPKER